MALRERVLAVGRATSCICALILVGHLLACQSDAARLSPADVHVSQSNTTLLRVEGLAPHTLLRLTPDGVEPRPGMTAWIGDEEADIVRVDAAFVELRARAPLAVGSYPVSVRVGGRVVVATPELRVFDERVDAGPMPDLSVPDGGNPDLGSHDGGTPDLGMPDLSMPDMGAPDLGGSPTAPCTDADLVACYDFLGDTLDLAPPGLHDLTATGASFPSTPTGTGVQCGAGGSLSAPDRAELDVSTVMIEVLFTHVDAASGSRYMLADKNGSWGLYVQDVGGSETLRCAGLGVSLQAALPAATGRYVHAVCALGQGSASLYIDGQRVDSTTAGGSLSNSNADLHIGEDSPDGDDQYTGVLDLVRIWGTPVHDEQAVCALALTLGAVATCD